jgi:hypothetical protein
MEYVLLHPEEPDVVEKASEAFLKTYRQNYGPDLDELFWPKTPNQCLRALHEYVGKYYPKDHQDYEVLATEIAGKISVDDERYLYFRMDSVVRDRKSLEVGSLEHKTGSRLDSRWREKWDMSLQAGTYYHVLRSVYSEVFVVIFNGVFFKKVKTPTLQLDFGRAQVTRTNDQMLTWWSNTLYWLDQLEEEHRLLSELTDKHDTMMAFPMNVTNCDKYFGCTYRAFCDAWTNPLRRCDEPPLGMKCEFWDPSEREAKTEIKVRKDGKTTIKKTESSSSDKAGRTP